MKRLFSIFLYFATVVLLLLVVSCQQQPESTPSSDEPELSEDEVCSLIWTKIPSELPDGYSKNDLFTDSGKAEYEGDGRWLFSAFGKVEKEGLPTIEILRVEGCWAEREF